MPQSRPAERVATVVRRLGSAADIARGEAARLVRLGRGDDEIWLDWRVDRQRYCVASYDRSARSGRRKLTDVGAGSDDNPPVEAHQALARAYAGRSRTPTPQIPTEVGLSHVLTRYLAEHCAPVDRLRERIADPARQAYSIAAVERWIADQHSRGRLLGVLTIADVGKAAVEGFVGFRRSEGVGDATIKRDLGVVRAAVAWAKNADVITTRPEIPKLLGQAALKTRGRKLAYSPPQVAALLDAAWSMPARQHAHLFMVAMLASHARSLAVLECDLDHQYHDGVIDWLAPGRGQTKKRRAMTPVGPTFAAWLEGRRGKLIQYRAPIAARRWRVPEIPEYFAAPTRSIETAWTGVVLAAAAAHPGLGLRAPMVDEDGRQSTRLVRRDGRQLEELCWSPVGTPNTMRHTVHTRLRHMGVPKAQIDAASGHAEQGTGETYNHADARHDLRAFVEGTEQLFTDLRTYTTAHLRTHSSATIVDFGAARANRVG